MANKIQILRNATLATSRDAAASALKTKLGTLSDGEIAIARYEVGEEGKKELKVLLGFSYKAEGATAATPFIFDADAVPADVQSEIKKLIGTESDTSESVTIYGAKKYADEKVSSEIGKLDVSDSITAGSFVASVSETDGKISVTKGAVASSDKTVVVTGNASTGGLDLKTNIDGTTIVKNDETGVLSVASSALTQYVGSYAIAVSEAGEDNNKTISLGINANDKVLTQSTDGLIANIAMSYDTNARTINLTGKSYSEEGTEKAYSLGSIDASQFIKDGMLAGETVFVAEGATQTITINKQSHEFTGLTIGSHYIVFLFSTYDGTTKETKYSWDILDATSIIDVYVAGDGLALSDHTFSVKKSEESDSEGFLSVSSNGVKVSGVQTAINTAAAKAKSVVALKEGESHLELAASTETTDGHTIYTLNTKDVASATDLSNEVTRATNAEDKIEASVGLANDGSHVTTTGNYTKNATTVVGEIAALDAQVKTNADAIGVLKGDDTVNGSVAKSIKDAVEALDVTGVGGTGEVITTISETNGKISATATKLTATIVAATATAATDTKVAVTGTTVEAQIASLATSIAKIDCGTY